MLNQFKPGSILAMLTVLMGTMYWLIFALCNNVSRKMNSGGDFMHNYWIYFVIGILLPLVGLSGGIVNLYKNDDADERPIWILFIGLVVLLGSIILDAKMIIDAFSGGGLHNQPLD